MDSKSELIRWVRYVKKATKWIAEHDISGILIANTFDARDFVEDHWELLSEQDLKAMHEFDRIVFREIDWLLQEDPILALPDTRPEDASPERWWWFIREIKAGTVEPPAYLKGAA